MTTTWLDQRVHRRQADVRRERARVRDRAYRRRQAAGRMLVAVEVGPGVLDLLCRLRWLTENETGDKRAVGEAIGAMLKDAMRR